jgi:hypothetical protein
VTLALRSSKSGSSGLILLPAGWRTLSVPVSRQLRLPHPLRFSKGGNLERLRHEMFSVSIFNFMLLKSLHL